VIVGIILDEKEGVATSQQAFFTAKHNKRLDGRLLRPKTLEWSRRRRFPTIHTALTPRWGQNETPTKQNSKALLNFSSFSTPPAHCFIEKYRF